MLLVAEETGEKLSGDERQQIAINTLLRRTPDLRLAAAPGTLRWRKGSVLRGP